jgi:hypothetical protein
MPRPASAERRILRTKKRRLPTQKGRTVAAIARAIAAEQDRLWKEYPGQYVAYLEHRTGNRVRFDVLATSAQYAQLDDLLAPYPDETQLRIRVLTPPPSLAPTLRLMS